MKDSHEIDKRGYDNKRKYNDKRRYDETVNSIQAVYGSLEIQAYLL